MKPNGYVCEGCPKWDDVNGCWNDCKTYLGKNCIGDDLDEVNEDEESPKEIG